jgi:UDP-3-O-[3-hydroxymyristoyl] glucosamine N-acyltransferase
MPKKLSDIAASVNGIVRGNPEVSIFGVAGIREAQEGDITFLANPKYLPLAATTRASAIVVGRGVETQRDAIVVENPSLAFVKICSLLMPRESNTIRGVHATAAVSPTARLGRDAAVGAYAVIEDDAEIGEGSVISSFCFVGKGTRIGRRTLLYPHVTVREQVSVGDGCIIHSGAVIGADGFGFVTVEGEHHKVPQVGTVEIQDAVEIGANVTIDRARFNKTVVGRGTKIDNLVQIAHNVVVGEHCLIVAQAGISGSTVIGNGVTIAGQAGLTGHISVGDGAIIAAQAGVTKPVRAGTLVSGYPAQDHDTAKRINAYVQGLPKMHEELKRLKARIEELERKLTS